MGRHSKRRRRIERRQTMSIAQRLLTQAAFITTLLTAVMQGFVPGAAMAEPIISVTGYGNYCSKTWPTGGSTFGYVSNGGDPCEYIDPKHSGTTQRKGLYSSSGWNNVVLRCNQGVWFWTGVGNAPLDWAYETAYKNKPNKSNCISTVASREMPIFDAPVDDLSVCAGTGFDFARPPYNTLDVTLFGQSGSKTATIVDLKGRDKSNPACCVTNSCKAGETCYVSDHAGYDWGIAKGTPLKAVADGVVVRAEKYYKTVDKCNNYEAHVYIKHKVCGMNNYCEQFVSYYTHMDSVQVSVGQVVHKGESIGTSGNSGCVSAHLHYTVARLTNTADKLLESLKFTDNGTTTFSGQMMKKNVASNVYNWAIDPYGWDATWPDPWGWKVYGQDKGAMSIKLWVPGKAPCTGSW